MNECSEKPRLMCCLREQSHLRPLAQTCISRLYAVACRRYCASRHITLHGKLNGRWKNNIALCAGVPGDGHTYAALTRGYAQAGDLQRALGILDHMVEAGGPTV
jgi:pentatricopeptide repeat protein